MASGVYKITNIINKHCYIGSAINLDKRKYEHFRTLKNGSHKNRHFQNAYNKHGLDAFIFEVLEICDKFDVVLREQFYINLICPEYNIAKVAGSTLGIRLTEEARQKLSIAHKGKTISQETRDKMGASRKGRTHSPEARAKIGEANRCRSPEVLARQSLAMRGRVFTKEHCVKISLGKIGGTPWNKGRVCTPEENKKNSEAHKGGIPWNKGKKYKMPRKKP